MSIAVLIAALAAEPGALAPPPRAAPTATERGDPVLADQLAERAQAAIDERDAVRLLIAAAAVAPDDAGHRLAVADAVLGTVAPQPVNGGPLGNGGSVRYAALSAGGSWLVLDREDGGQLWQLFATDHVLRLAADLPTPILGASAGTHPVETRILVAYPDGVDLWEAVWTRSSGRARNEGRIIDIADAVAVSHDAQTAVTVAATTATVWDINGRARPITSLTYDQAVTTLELPPSNDLLLVAGHGDGSATVDRIDLTGNSSQRRVLTGAEGPIGAVTISADGSTALAVTRDGSLTAWRTTLDRSGAATTIAAAGSARAGTAGAYQLWLSPAGSYALVMGSSEPAAVWSLADPSHPVKLRDLGTGTDPAIPGMVTFDGRRIVTIDRDNTLTVWDTAAVVDTLADPLPRACELADLTEQVWRQIVPDPAYPNPCPSSPGVPTVNVHTGPADAQ